MKIRYMSDECKIIGSISGFNTPSEKKQNYTNEKLKTMQEWDLDRKIKVSQTRLLEWYGKRNGKVYISFSGGKDSTVLADLAARVCKVCKPKINFMVF